MFSEQKGGVSWEHIPKKTNEWSSRLELSLEPVDFVNLDLPPFAGLQELQHPATAHMMLSQKNMCTSVLRNSSSGAMSESVLHLGLLLLQTDFLLEME